MTSHDFGDIYFKEIITNLYNEKNIINKVTSLFIQQLYYILSSNKIPTVL